MDIWGSNKKNNNDENDYLKNLEKKRQEKEILKEYTKERKLRAIDKIQKVLDLPFFTDYNTEGLSTFQRLTILQLLRKIGECEGEIPREFWCKSCKRKEKRVKELIKRFRDNQKNCTNLNKRKDLFT
ncbi:MAG: hypothetical protein KAW92_10450 [Candidatus Cloacimonetes bacterium]|nr:hypothetical protein [Candidatus Cloacimonadota bacterium]